MKTRNDLTPEQVRERLSYDPETGDFIWKSGRFAGQIAGCVRRYGYRQISIDGAAYLAHRLAFLITFDRWPEVEIDHINGDPSDNRISNLREATSAENNQSRAIHKNNRSGFTGVCWNKQKQKWFARIKVNGRSKFLGCFDSLEKANETYFTAKKTTHTFNPVHRANHNQGSQLIGKGFEQKEMRI